MMRSSITAMIAFAAAAFAVPAQAEVIPCSSSDITFSPGTYIDCAGFVENNQLGGSPSQELTATQLLAELGFVFTGDNDGIEMASGLEGDLTVDLDTLLIGQTIIGIHFGNGKGGPGNATAFYLFDALAGLDTFQLNLNASSSVVLYQTGQQLVPEPATWAMMILGFGIVGMAMRRGRRKSNRALAAVA